SGYVGRWKSGCEYGEVGELRGGPFRCRLPGASAPARSPLWARIFALALRHSTCENASSRAVASSLLRLKRSASTRSPRAQRAWEIGRASCREGVERWESGRV